MVARNQKEGAGKRDRERERERERERKKLPGQAISFQGTPPVIHLPHLDPTFYNSITSQ
jgi:hypothetical protein